MGVRDARLTQSDCDAPAQSLQLLLLCPLCLNIYLYEKKCANVLISLILTKEFLHGLRTWNFAIFFFTINTHSDINVTIIPGLVIIYYMKKVSTQIMLTNINNYLKLKKIRMFSYQKKLSYLFKISASCYTYL